MRRIWILLLSILCVGIFSGCDAQEVPGENHFQVYMLNHEETKVEAHPYSVAATEKEEMLEDLLNALAAQPERLEYKPPLSLGFQVLSASMVDNKIYLDLDEAYRNLSPTTE
ncbi:MAG: GerMN domain-containing protein, partial [Lachnospiraceae bacterium]|nr:GerMN domain-containing protein [Lachnospiraceae bacterium]